MNNKKPRVSQVIFDAVQKLQYTPGQGFRRKVPAKDLSGLLGPIGLFTDAFLRVLDNVVLHPKAARNLVSVRINMKKQIPKIVADVQLVLFFAAWEIEVIGSSKSPSPPPDGDEARQLQMAILASKTTAGIEAARRRQEEDDDMLLDLEPEDPEVVAAITAHAEAEKSRKAILQELDIINSAITHRLARWAQDFPKPEHADLLWPYSFNKAERKQIKSFVRQYIEENDMWLRDINVDKQLEAIEDMKKHADFPLEHARNAGIIQSCFLDLRKDKKRWSRTPDSRDPSTAGSRSVSPVKQSIENRMRGAANDDDDDDDDHEGTGPIQPKRARTTRTSTGTNLRTSYTMQDLDDDDAAAAAAEDAAMMEGIDDDDDDDDGDYAN